MTDRIETEGRDELSRLLVTLRGHRSQAEAARLSGLSQSKISRAERGRFLLTADETVAYGSALGGTSRQLSRLGELTAARASAHVAGRVALVRVAAAIQERIGRLEDGAHSVAAWQPVMVPGIAQTESYTAAVLDGDGGGDPGPAWWVARRARTARLAQAGRTWHVLMSEAALRWRIGSPPVMVEQLDHLVELSQMPGIRLGIVPLDSTLPMAAPAAFHMYDDVVSVATEVGTSFVDDHRDVAHFTALLRRIDALARHGDAARTLLRHLARGNH